MSANPATGSVRDVVPSRVHFSGGSVGPGATSIQVIGGDIDRPQWFPTPGAVHTIATSTSDPTFTITDATVPLPYDLKDGEGFSFIVQNNGTGTVTIARAGFVVAGSGTLTVATNTSRMFFLCRIASDQHQLTTFGTLTH